MVVVGRVRRNSVVKRVGEFWVGEVGDDVVVVEWEKGGCGWVGGKRCCCVVWVDDVGSEVS